MFVNILECRAQQYKEQQSHVESQKHVPKTEWPIRLWLFAYYAAQHVRSEHYKSLTDSTDNQHPAHFAVEKLIEDFPFHRINLYALTGQWHPFANKPSPFAH